MGRGRPPSQPTMSLGEHRKLPQNCSRRPGRLKKREWKTWHEVTRVENAGVDNGLAPGSTTEALQNSSTLDCRHSRSISQRQTLPRAHC